MKILRVITFFLFCSAAAVSPAPAQTPQPPAPGQPWRVIYVEAGPYLSFHATFRGLLQGLYELNLLSELPPPEADETEDPARLWRWLAETSPGLGLEFPADGFYSAAWSADRLAEFKTEILARAERGEVDIILAFGTAAGRALVSDELRVPILSIGATDPVATGISLSAEDSGRDNVHVQVLSGVIEYQQLALFHNIFGFKTLGVPYDRSPDGQRAMAIPTVEQVAAERGFTIVPCVTDLEIEDADLSVSHMKSCLEFLAPKSEAIYLPVNNGIQTERMAELLEPIIAHKRPSFSQTGPAETKLGVLLSMGETDFINTGRFEADAIQKIMNGTSPRSINQLYLPPVTLALNLKMARLIGWNPPYEVLAAMDELYNKVAGRN